MSNDHPTGAGTPQRHSRRRVLGLLGVAGAAGAVATAGAITHRAASAADPTPTPAIQSIQTTSVGEMPSTGALRPGPVGQQPAQVTSHIATTPVTIRITAAQVDAEVESLDITNGVMANPTGPWVVSWYRQTSELGEGGNVVMAGHVDYWGVGPSVFYHLRDVKKGDRIQITGANKDVFTYAVDWYQVIGMAELTGGKIQELVGRTNNSVLTLITCGGDFDYATGEYLSRSVVRATLTRG
jgi:LPXTG-site transpeptidase (sortase) family protein